MKGFLCELLFGCLGSAPVAAPIEDLTYGTVLYAYYQNDYQDALVQTLVAERRARTGDDAVRFELARGSFAFADGMYDLAQRTFDGVDRDELTELDRMRLSFHLAREFYRRRDWDRLDAELQNIDLGETWRGRDRIHPEVEFMRAEVATERGSFDAALDRLARLEDDDPLRAYGLFNLGVAQRAAGELEAAENVFRIVADLPAADDETFDLVQRARLALAMVEKQRGRVDDAEAILARLPAGGRYRDLALATYGGLAMATDNHELAARIWMTLQKQSFWTPSTATARLGFPVSLEHLASLDMALSQYQAAERSFEGRLTTLTELRRRASDPEWVHSLLEVFASPDASGATVNAVMGRWQEELGHTDWLEWLSTEDVHQVLSDWRRLNDERRWLATLPEQLVAFDGLAREQQARAQRARLLLEDDGLIQRRTALREQTEAQKRRLEGLAAATPERNLASMSHLAEPEERAVLDELAGMRGVFEQAPQDEKRRLLARLDRLEGVLFWNMATSRAVRLRGIEGLVANNERLLAEVDDRIERVRRAEAEYTAGVAADFTLLADRASALTGRIDRAIAAREEALAGELRRGMQAEAEQVQRFLLVTRVAIARATDKLALQTGSRP